MSSSRAVLRGGLLALVLLCGTTLAACSSFTPVYGDHGISAERVAFNYAKPASRLDQIIYQNLKLRLGSVAGPNDPTVRVTTTTRTLDLTESVVVRPSSAEEAVVTARIEVVDASGRTIYTATRSANAAYMIDNQALSQAEAEIDAENRAAEALAETIRLTLIGALAKPSA
jgi:LPS-assembly lipoprotein